MKFRMSGQSVNEKRKPRKKLAALITIAVLLTAAAAMYLLFTYTADDKARMAMQSDDTVSVTKMSYGYYFDGPSDDTAMIFYPGANVEETAYAPLMHELASAGVDACVVKVPFHIAFFGMNAADEVLKAHSFKNWYIGGHSLGGTIAAGYASDHSEIFSGVILMASYPYRDMPDNMTLVQLTGSEDHVINRERMKDAVKYCPENYIDHRIEGGNHSGFGSYGLQVGDGTAYITQEEQVRETVDVITALAA